MLNPCNECKCQICRNDDCQFKCNANLPCDNAVTKCKDYHHNEKLRQRLRIKLTREEQKQINKDIMNRIIKP